MKPAKGRLIAFPRDDAPDPPRAVRHKEDPYVSTRKPAGPTVCPECKAVFMEGRWTWQRPPSDAAEMSCPACQRIRDEFPAGYVTIKGEFFKQHKDEIVRLMENHEKKEKAARPLQRIMAMDQKRDGFEVQTTDSHLARGIAEALHDAFKGDLKVRYSRDENLVRAVWKRER